MAAMECKTKCSEKSIFTSGTTIPCSPDPLYTLRPHAGEVTDVHYVPNSYLVSGTTSGRLGIWDISLKREIWFQECTNPILSVNSLSAHNNILSQTLIKHIAFLTKHSTIIIINSSKINT